MEDTNEGRSGTGQAHRAAPTRDAARSITVSVADAAKKNSRIDLCSHLKVVLVVTRRGRRGRLTPPDDVTPSAGSDSANRLDRTTHYRDYAYAFGSRTVYLSCNASCCGTTMLRNR